jgi:hypothetical protein
VREDQAHRDPQQGRLSRAILAPQPRHHPGLEGQRGSLEHRFLAPTADDAAQGQRYGIVPSRLGTRCHGPIRLKRTCGHEEPNVHQRQPFRGIAGMVKASTEDGADSLGQAHPLSVQRTAKLPKIHRLQDRQSMILSHTHKFIFICNCRVGTTSMEEALRPFQEGAEYDFGSTTGVFIPKHIPPAILKGTLPDSIWNSYFKFVFVRNPWDWCVSQWFYNQLWSADVNSDLDGTSRVQTVRHRLARRLRGARRRLPDHAEASGRQTTQPPPPEETQLRARDIDVLFEALKPFRGMPGRESLLQSTWVYDLDGRSLVDHVGRYETLQADFDLIRRRLNLDISLPHLNQTGHRDYRTYYADGARERVAELWALDVANFGYDFDGEVGPVKP